MAKVCTKCHIEKSDLDFYPNKKCCKSCHRAYMKDWAEKNKKKVKDSRKKWADNNKEKFRTSRNNCIKKKPDKYKALRNKSAKDWKERNKDKAHAIYLEKQRRGRENVATSYIKKILKHNKGWTDKQIKENPEIIEVQKQIIKIKRYAKDNQY